MTTGSNPFYFLWIPVLLIVNAACAQAVPDSVIIETDSLKKGDVIQIPDAGFDHIKYSHFEAGMSYQSNDVFLGRKDSAVLPYFIPEFTYFHKSGLYASVSLNYLKNATDSRIDLIAVEGGYLFSTGKYEGQFSGSKYFYNRQSTSVTSGISASFSYENSYDLGFIKPSAVITLNIGSKLDFAALFGVEHTFYLLDDKLNLTPTFAFNASTQNYYNDYYRERLYTIKRKGQQPQTGVATISGTVLNASAFKLLDYEPALPVNYLIGNCTIHFTPTYSIPVNPATVDIQTVKENGTVIERTRTEKLGNTFFWTLGISFLF